jgi:hypothetical protein
MIDVPLSLLPLEAVEGDGGVETRSCFKASLLSDESNGRIRGGRIGLSPRLLVD